MTTQPHDDFLRAGRTRPRPEFAETLYRSLAPLPTERRLIPMSLSTLFAPRRLALGGLALVAALALTLAVSPVARAQLAGLLRVVGGITYNEVDPNPGPAAGAEPAEVANYTLSLAEAQASLGFELAVPSWAPAGYILQDDVTVVEFPDSGLTFARVAWYSDAGQVIDLQAEYPGTATWEVGPDSLEEITVNGAPAAVLRGMWNADTGEWVHSSAISLNWRRGDVTYHLSSSNGATSVAILVQMAESIP